MLALYQTELHPEQYLNVLIIVAFHVFNVKPTDLGCLAPFDLLSFDYSVSHGARHPFLAPVSPIHKIQHAGLALL